MMEKTKLGTHPVLYPMPAFLVGSNVNKKPNFMTVAWAGVACNEPPLVSVAIRSSRYTLKGIRETGVFSINIPSVTLLKEADYCGIVSGAVTDKVKDCGFKIFYGILQTAPMIEQCPLNLECRVEQQLELGSHILVIGRIIETYISRDCLTEGKPDVNKIKPLIYTSRLSSQYYGFGEVVGAAFSAGKALIKKE
jgi:flavin reductase (DIM6/NTAB) family NADH-FMN oxidoreductase RutF